MRELLSLPERIQEATVKLSNGGVIFCKHMAKHADLYDFENEYQSDQIAFEYQHKHLLLLRDPVAVLSSWGVAGSVHGHNPTVEEVGIVPLLSIYSTLVSRAADDNTHKCLAFLDSDDLVKDPETALESICLDLKIDYTASMMEWKAGPHACDGPWAAWWYANVHKSNGWKRNTSAIQKYYDTQEQSTQGENTKHPEDHHQYRTLDPALLPALRASFPAYQYLKSLTRGYQSRGPAPSAIYEDPRNQHLLCFIGAPGRGQLVPRDMAAISPWDSSVQGGDACWEGLRVYRGKILSLDKHLRRLLKSAKALGFQNVHDKHEIVHAIFQTLAANGMRDGAHMRLTLTRGEKCTSSMNPKFNVYGTTLIVLAEWKPPEGATTYDNTKGISLITASQRRNPPHTVDSKVRRNNLPSDCLCDNAIEKSHILFVRSIIPVIFYLSLDSP